MLLRKGVDTVFDSYAKCTCGAITLYMEDGTSYSCEQKKLREFFPSVDLRRIKRLQPTFCCDHCVNHYGLDLCGCGSGEPFGECQNGLEACKIPMQKRGEYTRVIAEDALF